MNIGVVCFPSYGGSGIVATELGKLFANQGHTIHFISYRQPAKLNQYFSNIFFHEVPLLSYPLFEYIPYESAFISKIIDISINENLDIIHVHYAIPNAHIAISAKNILKKRGVNIPIMLTLHGTDITLVGKDKTYSSVIEHSINSCDKVTAVSQHLKDETLNFFNITNSIEVVYNFVDINKYHQPISETIKKRIAPNGEKIIIHVSNFRKVKRVQDVVNVFVKLKKNIPIKLVLVGDGPEKQNVSELCRKSQSCNDILMLGKVDNLENILANVDLFILTSEQESFGLASLEAMAASIPIISTNIGGIPEVVTDGYSGFLNDVGDIESMYNNALTLLSDEKLMLTFKQNALKDAQKFEASKIYRQYENIYTNLVKN